MFILRKNILLFLFCQLILTSFLLADEIKIKLDTNIIQLKSIEKKVNDVFSINIETSSNQLLILSELDENIIENNQFIISDNNKIFYFKCLSPGLSYIRFNEIKAGSIQLNKINLQISVKKVLIKAKTKEKSKKSVVQKKETPLGKVSQLYARELYQEALFLTDRELNKQPDELAWVLLKARILKETQGEQEALDYLETFKEASEKTASELNSHFYLALTDLRIENQQYPEALNSLLIIDTKEKSLQTRVRERKLYLFNQLEKYKAVIEFATELLNKKNIKSEIKEDSYYYLAIAYEKSSKLRDIERAVYFYQQLIRHFPNSIKISFAKQRVNYLTRSFLNIK